MDIIILFAILTSTFVLSFGIVLIRKDIDKLKKKEINMEQVECPIVDYSFEYENKNYDCEHAINRDIKMILQEAKTSHKDSFDKLYNRDSLKADKVNIFLDEEGNPVFGMIIYLIEYKDGTWQRCACGGYYPVWENMLLPHLFQESICW